MMQIPVEYILSCCGHVSAIRRGFTKETATRPCADHAGSFSRTKWRDIDIQASFGLRIPSSENPR